MSILYVAIRGTRVVVVVVVVVVYAYVVRTRRENFLSSIQIHADIYSLTMVQLLERGTRLNLCGVIRRGCAEYKTLSTRD